MDRMIADGKIQYPDIVKIDVEGAEGLVVAGMKKTLALNRKPQHIFIELHRKYIPLFGSTLEDIANNITSCGYVLEECWERRNELLCHYKST